MRSRSSRRRSGFSLVEVFIALGILGFGLLAVAAMQLIAMKDASKARHLTGSAMIARDQIERMQRVPFSQVVPKAFGASETWMAGAGLTHGNVSVIVDEAGGSTTVEQVYTVDWRITAVTPINQDLMNVEVAVTWIEPDQTTNRTFGLSTIIVDNSR